MHPQYLCTAWLQKFDICSMGFLSHAAHKLTEVSWRLFVAEVEEASSSLQQTREGVSFSAFKKVVEQAVSWDHLEAMLA